MTSFEHTLPGILPCQSIELLIANGAITTDTPFDPDQVQPASLDLRLSDQAWRVRAWTRGRLIKLVISQFYASLFADRCGLHDDAA